MKANEIAELLAEDNISSQLYMQSGSKDFARNIEIANRCRAKRKYELAAYFFGQSLEINPNSHHVLLAKLMNNKDAGVSDACHLDELAQLEIIDKGFADYFRLVESPPQTRGDIIPQLRKLGPACESFETGDEPDWLYLRLVRRILNSEDEDKVNKKIPDRIFIYWDSDTPDAIRENINIIKI